MGIGFLSGEDIEIPSAPVNDPACWKGEDHQASIDWHYWLDDDDIAELNAAIAHTRRRGLSIMEVTRADFPLAGLGDKMRQIRRDLIDGRGFALLRGLPLDDYSREEAALAYWGLGTHLGYVVSQNGKGHLLGHVLDIGERSEPAKGEENKGTFVHSKNYGNLTSERLDYHVDWADLIGLLCLHPAMKGGESRIVSSIALHNAIMERRPDLVATLYEPFWVDRKGEIPTGCRPYFQMPVFNSYGGRLTTYFPGGHMMTPGTYPEVPAHSPAQLEAIDLFRQLANLPELHLSMTMQKGDVQFLNNHTVLHSRTAFTDFPEPEKRRHLLRLWWVAPDSRPLPHWFYERYGAGRRGGIYMPGVSENVPLEI